MNTPKPERERRDGTGTRGASLTEPRRERDRDHPRDMGEALTATWIAGLPDVPGGPGDHPVPRGVRCTDTAGNIQDSGTRTPTSTGPDDVFGKDNVEVRRSLLIRRQVPLAVLLPGASGRRLRIAGSRS